MGTQFRIFIHKMDSQLENSMIYKNQQTVGSSNFLGW